MSKMITGHILVVDDDAEIRDMLQSFLQLSNFQVTTCETAAEADMQLQNNTFSTLLVDVFLPDMDGIEFIGKINDKGIKTPVIIITGSSEVEIARKAVRLDVYDYLIKPFKQKQLMQIVRNAVMKNQLMEEQVVLDEQRLLYQTELEKMIQMKISELQESETKYRSLLEQSLVGIFIQKDVNFRYVNSKTCSIFECKNELLLRKKSLLDFVQADEKEKIEQLFRDKLAGITSTNSITFRVTTEESNERILEMWVDAVTYQGSPAIEGMIVDITEQQQSKTRERQLELHLLNEHKLSAIGRLTAGISHNLNTPISIIQGNVELLKLAQPDLKEVDIILRQTARMSDIIKTIAKKGQDEQNAKPVEIDLNKLIQDELSFLNANLFFKHHIQKELSFEEHLPTVTGLYRDFSQSLLHIIQNAIDAVYDSETRKISISTKLVDKYILIQITDTGSGINEEDKKKIFSPFFTTKQSQLDVDNVPEAPRGSGLGLSLAKNSLARYGVEIEFESVAGQGTTFTVKIPRPE